MNEPFELFNLIDKYDGEPLPVTIRAVMSTQLRITMSNLRSADPYMVADEVQALYDWCNTNIGKDDYSFFIMLDCIDISFKDHEDAALFKLVHG